MQGRSSSFYAASMSMTGEEITDSGGEEITAQDTICILQQEGERSPDSSVAMQKLGGEARYASRIKSIITADKGSETAVGKANLRMPLHHSPLLPSHATGQALTTLHYATLVP